MKNGTEETSDDIGATHDRHLCECLPRFVGPRSSNLRQRDLKIEVEAIRSGKSGEGESVQTNTMKDIIFSARTRMFGNDERSDGSRGGTEWICATS